jgi:L-alanine-DL-glutamate epimerase-like enolase superfamily enzyme
VRITDLEVLRLRNPLPEVVAGLDLHRADFSTTLVRIHTDDGVTGIGESWLPHSDDSPLGAHIAAQFRRVLIGEDPQNAVWLWHKMWAALYYLGGFSRGLAAVDMALWDLKAKAVGLPLYQLLGGKAQDRLALYATTPQMRGSDLDGLVTDILRFHAAGFGIVKLVVGRGIDVDKELLAHVAPKLAGRVRFAIDANGAYDVPAAVALGKFAERYDPLWFEEPLPSTDVRGLATVTARVDLPISGFQEESTIWRLREYLQMEALDAYNVTIEGAGGVTSAVRMSHMVEAFRKRWIPHGFGPPIAWAATINVAFAHPGCGPVEFPIPDRAAEFAAWSAAPYVRNRSELKPDPDGYISPPTGPGLGIDIDEEVLQSLVAG